MTRDIYRSTYAQALVVLIIAFAAYANSLGNDFVYDDKLMLVDNPWIGDFSRIPDIFTSNVWAFDEDRTSNFYRPAYIVFLMVEYRLFGLDPVGYHISHILLHMVVSASFLIVVRELFKKGGYGDVDYVPLMAATLFATHPIHTEIVTWGGSHDMFVMIMTLLCLHFHMKGRPAPALAAFIAALLTKETAIVIPVLLLAYDFSFERGKFSGPVAAMAKRIGLAYLPYLIAAAAYLLIRSHAIGGFSPVSNHPELTTFTFALNIVVLFADYMVKLVMPINLLPMYLFDPVTSLADPKAVFSIAVAAAFVSALVISAKRSPLVFFSLAFIAVPLMPVMYIPAFGNIVFAERYLYIPSAGFTLIVSLCLYRLASRCLDTEKSATAAATAVALTISAIFLVATAVRNTTWKNNMAHHQAPQSGKDQFDPERVMGLFELYFEQKAEKDRRRKDKFQEFSMEYALSQVFSPKQKELFKKKLEGSPLTKTEKEYYSRTVKKKVVALANSELHSLSRKLLEQ